MDPLSRERDESLRKWQDKTPARAALRGPAKPKAKGKGKDGKKKKK